MQGTKKVEDISTFSDIMRMAAYENLLIHSMPAAWRAGRK